MKKLIIPIGAATPWLLLSHSHARQEASTSAPAPARPTEWATLLAADLS